MILLPSNTDPRCTCVVDLAAKHQRPYNFIVTVTGEPPHAYVRRYLIAAPTDDEAAFAGIQHFVNEFRPKVIVEQSQPLAPKAKRLN